MTGFEWVARPDPAVDAIAGHDELMLTEPDRKGGWIATNAPVNVRDHQ